MNNFQEVYGNKENQAPEIIEHRPYNGIRVDIFSLGKLLLLVFDIAFLFL